MGAYRQDGADEITTLARYLWNIAVCESLYSPLQMVEIALRNAAHAAFSHHYKTDKWYDNAPSNPFGQRQLDIAKESLAKRNKPVTPGHVVAELHFGFWTAFFNRVPGTPHLIHLLPSAERCTLLTDRRCNTRYHSKNVASMTGRVTGRGVLRSSGDALLISLTDGIGGDSFCHGMDGARGGSRHTASHHSAWQSSAGDVLWRRRLCGVSGPDGPVVLRRHKRTGRPLRDEDFLPYLEQLMCRPLRRKKPGPKPRRKSSRPGDKQGVPGTSGNFRNF